MKRLLPLIIASAAFALAPAPAAAQDEAGDKVNTVMVFGDDPCQQSTENELTICVRMDEQERYRIPEALRQSSDPANEAWANKVRAYEAVGDFGPLSCSPIGGGGDLGCTAQFIEQAYAERRSGPGVRAGELIAAARDERLATIDEEAAATQARVEDLERQYMERVRQEDEGQVAPPAPASSTPVVVSTSGSGN
jgi:hypothetical protein